MAYKYEDIIADLKNKIYKPVYFLMGEEPYYIDLITKFIEDNILEEGERDFNQTVFYGKDSDITTIIETAYKFPMMSNYQVIIVKEAQELKKYEDALTRYVETPMTSTMLVFAHKYKKADSRKKFIKTIDKSFVLFDSKKKYDNEIPAWINVHLKEKGYLIDPKACQMIAENIGNDLGKIDNELNKLIIALDNKTTKILPDHVEKNIGISKEYNVFELNNALGDKNIIKANKIINHFAYNEKNNPIQPIMANLYSFFEKLLKYHTLKDKSKANAAAALGVNPYFIGDYEKAARNYSGQKLISIISLLREYDMKSKGVDNISASNGALLKELVFKILH